MVGEAWSRKDRDTVADSEKCKKKEEIHLPTMQLILWVVNTKMG